MQSMHTVSMEIYGIPLHNLKEFRRESVRTVRRIAPGRSPDDRGQGSSNELVKYCLNGINDSTGSVLERWVSSAGDSVHTRRGYQQRLGEDRSFDKQRHWSLPKLLWSICKVIPIL